MKEHCVEFNQLAMANAEGSDDMLNRVMTKDNIGLAAMLEIKEGAYDNGECLLCWCDPLLKTCPAITIANRVRNISLVICRLTERSRNRKTFTL